MQTTSHVNPSLTELGDKFTQLEPDSMTVEEGDLIYALVRMRKPKLAIETGTGHCAATKRIAEALAANGEGELISCDTDQEFVEEGRLTVPSMFVDIRQTSGLALLESLPSKADFILIDAGGVENRLKELQYIVEREVLSVDGLLVVHDAINGKYKQLVDYVKQHMNGLVFDSLAGIAVFQCNAKKS